MFSVFKCIVSQSLSSTSCFILWQRAWILIIWESSCLSWLIIFVIFTGAYRTIASAAGWTREPGIQDGGREAHYEGTTSRPDGETAGGGSANDGAASGTSEPNSTGTHGTAGGAEEGVISGTTCWSGCIRNWNHIRRFNLHPKDSWTGRLVFLLHHDFFSGSMVVEDGWEGASFNFTISAISCDFHFLLLYVLQPKLNKKLRRPADQRPSSWKWKPGPSLESDSWRRSWRKARWDDNLIFMVNSLCSFLNVLCYFFPNCKSPLVS